MSGVHIDVPCTRLNSWLCNRGRLKKKWQADLRGIQEQVKEARKLLDVGLQEQFEGDAIGYFDVLKIISALEAQEKQSGKSVKTFFGGYTSDLLQKWDSIRQAYLNDNIFLAECGRALTQRLKYDIPRMRKLIQESGSQIEALSRKVSDREQLSRDWRVKYKAKCEDLGIRGVDIKRELIGTLAGLPLALEEVCATVRSEEVGAAMDLYKTYVSFLHSFESKAKQAASEGKKKGKKAAGDDGDSAIPALAALTRVREAKEYDLSSAAAAEKEVENGWALVDATDASGGNEEGKRGGVDWGIVLEGDDKNADGADAKKDDDSKADPDSAGGDLGISWDFEIEEETSGGGEAAPEGAAAAGEDIDWGISVDEEPTSSSSGLKGAGNAGDSKASSAGGPKQRQPHVLEDEDLRNKMTDDLLELRCFLTQRKAELDDGDSIGAGQYNKVAPELAKRCSSVAVMRNLKAVNKALEALRAPVVQRMLMILTGERYVARLTESVEQLDRNAKQTLESISQLRERQQAIRNSVTQNSKSLRRAVEGCKEMQKKLEEVLREMFPDAENIRIVGEINKL